ncbi:MAG: ABC transporter permease [Treponema sp.]|nr:ABC transporter permease [Treponema sp.]
MKKVYSVYTDLILGFLIPFGAALIIPVCFILAGSAVPVRILEAFFIGPWSTPWFLGNTLDNMTLLLTASLGAVIAFRAGCFNLGGEGQIYLGGCAAAVVLLNKSSLSGTVMLVLAAAAAMATGSIMGGISGLLRKKFGASELITSFLLAAALIPAGDHFISTVLRSPGVNLLATDKIASGRILAKLLLPSSLSVSIIIALFFTFLFHFFIHRTALGYRFRIAGAAPDLAGFAGIDAEKRLVPAMTLSGALSGMTGFFAVAGTYGMCYQGFSGGLGWNGIAIALIAGNEPLLLLPAVLIFGSIRAGSDTAMLQAGFGFETAAFIQAAVLLLAALPFGIRYLKGRGL